MEVLDRRSEAEARAIEAMAKVFFYHLTGSEYSPDVWTKVNEKKAWVAANDAFEAMWKALRTTTTTAASCHSTATKESER